MSGNAFDFSDDQTQKSSRTPRRKSSLMPWLVAGGAVLAVCGLGCCGVVAGVAWYVYSQVAPPPADPDRTNNPVSLQATWENRGRPVPELKHDWYINSGHPPFGPGTLWLVAEHHGQRIERKMGDPNPGTSGMGGELVHEFAGAANDASPARVWIEFRPADGQPARTVSRVVSAPDRGVVKVPTRKK